MDESPEVTSTTPRRPASDVSNVRKAASKPSAMFRSATILTRQGKSEIAAAKCGASWRPMMLTLKAESLKPVIPI
jgi:hypothetical protein